MNSAETQEFEDPLDFKIPDGEYPSTLTRIPKTFTITTDSYISLCSRVYAAFCSQHADFAESVSESAFQYYATFLLWKRFANLLSSSAKNKVRFWGEISDSFRGHSLPVPLYTYLQGIGHFREPHGFERKFILPTYPMHEEVGGVYYTFGEIDSVTHCFYEAFPAPGIAALRILADINFTYSKKNRIWDLPEALRPDEAYMESDKPTNNLLGWAPAKLLTIGQQDLFKSLKIDDSLLNRTDFASDNGVDRLCTKIDKLIRGCSDDPDYRRFGICESQPRSVMGSVVQGMTLHKFHTESFKFNRSVMYCEGNFSVSSPYKAIESLNKGAVVSGYRMAKEPVGNIHCWSCYDFKQYTSVPDSWIRSRNEIYTHGSVERLNNILWTTGYSSKRIFQNQCIQHSMFQNKEDWNIYK